MADWLTPEWVGEAAALCRLLPEAPGAEGSVTLSFVVAPRREVGFHWCYEKGRIARCGTGPAAESDLVLSLAATDAADLLAGRVEPSVAFMRGRLKATGDGGILLAFLESTTFPGYTGWREAVAAVGPVP